MKFHQFLATTLLSVFMLSVLSLSAQAAGFEYCFPLPSGQIVCFDIPVEEVRIPIPPDPGPKTPVDISLISEELTQLLGGERGRWIVADTLGERVFMMDLSAQQIYELTDVASPVQ